MFGSDLGNFCEAWEDLPSCSASLILGSCPEYTAPTGDYAIYLELFQKPPGCAIPEAGVIMGNENTGIRVRVARWGETTEKNVYFQNDAPDLTTCNRACSGPPSSGHCPEPPCSFDGECCHTCVYASGTCPGGQGNGCNVLDNEAVCGCEIAAETVTLEEPGDPDDLDQVEHGCELPNQGMGQCDAFAYPGECDAPAFCLMLSPRLDSGGIGFAIEALNFSHDDSPDCWYQLDPAIGIHSGDITEFIDLHCPDPDPSNLLRTCP